MCVCVFQFWRRNNRKSSSTEKHQRGKLEANTPSSPKTWRWKFSRCFFCCCFKVLPYKSCKIKLIIKISAFVIEHKCWRWGTVDASGTTVELNVKIIAIKTIQIPKCNELRSNAEQQLKFISFHPFCNKLFLSNLCLQPKPFLTEQLMMCFFKLIISM